MKLFDVHEYFKQRSQKEFQQDVEHLHAALLLRKPRYAQLFKVVEANLNHAKRYAGYKLYLAKKYQTRRITGLINTYWRADQRNGDNNFAAHFKYARRPFAQQNANILLAIAERDDSCVRGRIIDPKPVLQQVVDEFTKEYQVYELYTYVFRYREHNRPQDLRLLRSEGLTGEEVLRDDQGLIKPYMNALQAILASGIIAYARQYLKPFQRLVVFHKLCDVASIPVFASTIGNDRRVLRVHWYSCWSTRARKFEESHEDAHKLIKQLALDDLLVQSGSGSIQEGYAWDLDSPRMLFEARYGKEALKALQREHNRKFAAFVQQQVAEAGFAKLFAEAQSRCQQQSIRLYQEWETFLRIARLSVPDAIKLMLLVLFTKGVLVRLPESEQHVYLSGEYLVVTARYYEPPQVQGSSVKDYLTMQICVYRGLSLVAKDNQTVVFRTTQEGVINQGWDMEIKKVMMSSRRLVVTTKGKQVMLGIS